MSDGSGDRARWAFNPAKTILLGMALLCGLFLRPVSLFGQAPSSPEYQIKAAFLYNFGKFVEWPAHLPPPSGPADDFFRICILGDDPFQETIDSIKEQLVHNRAVRIGYPKAIQELESVQHCDILFISKSKTDELPENLRKIGNQPILTVTDQAATATSGAIINLRTVDTNVRFEINLKAASQAGIKISSQLLKLATRVIE